MGRQAPEGLTGIHMNSLVTTLGGAKVPAESEQERAAADAIATFRTSGFGYFLEQATRPQTIGYALLDSPVALAGWMLDHDTDAYWESGRAPRSWVEKSDPYLTYFNEVDKDGHFAAWEEPELFATEIRAAFKPLR